jgi:hypothetical protein
VLAVLALGACGGVANTSSDASPDSSTDAGTTPPFDGRAASAPDGSVTSNGLTSGICSASGWCWSDTTLQSNALTGVWGAGANDVWAVGAGGTILHWDGATWSPSASGTTATLRDVWGSASDDVWAVGPGTLLHWDGKAWANVVAALAPTFTSASLYVQRVWGTSATDVWAVCGSTYPAVPNVPNGAILHWNGSSWALVPSPNTNFFGGIWGSGPNDVWAFAAQSSVVHWDGVAWTAVDITPADLYQATHAWGSGAGDIWVAALGSDGLRYDGKTWRSLCNASSCPDAFAFWGTSASDVWAVGHGGLVTHWNGTTWTKLQAPTPQDLSAAWGSSSSDVWAVGDAGAIVHWDGSRWSGTGTTKTKALGGVWGSGPDDVWAVGDNPPDGSAVHWDGHAWSESLVRPAPLLVGANQGPAAEHLSAVWGSGPDDVWAVGDNGTNSTGAMLHRDGRARTPFPLPTATAPGFSLPTMALYAVWGSAPDDVWAGGGGGGERSMVHWDGKSWSAIVDTAIQFGETRGIWGSSASDVWAVGAQGSILHWTGTRWIEAPAPEQLATGAQTLYAVWGTSASDIWAVGGVNVYGGTAPGVILHYDGLSWVEVQTGLTDPLVSLQAVWSSGPTDVTAVGGDGIGADNVLHFDGTRWTASPSGTTQPLRGLWGLGANNLFAVGDGGVFLHH